MSALTLPLVHVPGQCPPAVMLATLLRQRGAEVGETELLAWGRGLQFQYRPESPDRWGGLSPWFLHDAVRETGNWVDAYPFATPDGLWAAIADRLDGRRPTLVASAGGELALLLEARGGQVAWLSPWEPEPRQQPVSAFLAEMRPRSWFLFYLTPRLPDRRLLWQKALRRTAERLLSPPEGPLYTGLPALERWAQGRPAASPPPAHLGGPEHDLFRGQFATGLALAAEVLEEPRLTDLAGRYRECGEAWQRFCRSGGGLAEVVSLEWQAARELYALSRRWLF